MFRFTLPCLNLLKISQTKVNEINTCERRYGRWVSVQTLAPCSGYSFLKNYRHQIAFVHHRTASEFHPEENQIYVKQIKSDFEGNNLVECSLSYKFK